VKVVVIIPALNEEGSIGGVVAAVPRDVVSDIIIREVPVTHRKRVGRSKVAGTLAGSLKAAYFILFTAFRHALRH
jgi:hypothetical protein